VTTLPVPRVDIPGGGCGERRMTTSRTRSRIKNRWVNERVGEGGVVGV